MIRTRGARLLRAVAHTQDEVADLVGVSRVAVSHWKNGGTKPVGKKRELLSQYFSIPPESWDDVDAPSVPPSKPSESRMRARTAPPPPKVPAAGDVDSSIAEMHEIMRGIDIDDSMNAVQKLTLLGRKAKVMRDLTAAEHSRMRQRGEDATSLGKFFAGKQWARVCESMERWIFPHCPKAAIEAFRDDMQRFEAEDD